MNPSSKYKVGDLVEINNKRGSTKKRGRINQIIWHHKDACYNYYLEDSKAKKVSKRYFEDELNKTNA